MFYAFLVNVIYGIFILFTDYGGLGSLIGAVIGSAIGLYLLFQIRGNYNRFKPKSRVAKAAKKS